MEYEEFLTMSMTNEFLLILLVIKTLTFETCYYPTLAPSQALFLGVAQVELK